MIENMVDRSTSWCLQPRDPVVFGDGSRIPALAPRHRFLLPPQGTLAGMVRTRFAADLADVSQEDAQRLLEIRLRGPWLARFQGTAQTPELWLPIPADVAAVRDDEWEVYLPSELLPLAGGEGTLWPDGTALRLLVQRRERLENGTKTSQPKFPFWPFDKVVRWNLDPATVKPIKSRSPKPVRPEYRVHVAIEDTTWTAEPEALFSSAGLRYDSDFGLVVEVLDGRGLAIPPGPAPGSPPHLLVLGAEARTVSCSVMPGPCFPSFDSRMVSQDDEKSEIDSVRAADRAETFRDFYRQQIGKLLDAGHRIGLRLQLLTPGSFGGWQPPWPEEFCEKLLAVCLKRHVPVSGWDLQAKGPRSVRRLVPAGSVYFLGPFDGATADKVTDLCSAWWGRSLCEGQEGDEKSFLAPPAHDGYGLVLPAPFGLPRSLMP